MVEAFGNATELTIKAGFDGVEIHGANGYLIQRFYSGHSNRRDDEWGGNREKRKVFYIKVFMASSWKSSRNNAAIKRERMETTWYLKI